MITCNSSPPLLPVRPLLFFIFFCCFFLLLSIHRRLFMDSLLLPPAVSNFFLPLVCHCYCCCSLSSLKCDRLWTWNILRYVTIDSFAQTTRVDRATWAEEQKKKNEKLVTDVESVSMFQFFLCLIFFLDLVTFMAKAACQMKAGKLKLYDSFVSSKGDSLVRKWCYNAEAFKISIVALWTSF